VGSRTHVHFTLVVPGSRLSWSRDNVLYSKKNIEQKNKLHADGNDNEQDDNAMVQHGSQDQIHHQNGQDCVMHADEEVTLPGATNDEGAIMVPALKAPQAPWISYLGTAEGLVVPWQF
jgi:hypothetical protein